MSYIKHQLFMQNNLCNTCEKSLDKIIKSGNAGTLNTTQSKLFVYHMKVKIVNFVSDKKLDRKI